MLEYQRSETSKQKQKQGEKLNKPNKFPPLILSILGISIHVHLWLKHPPPRRPLKNIQFCLSPRQVKILTTGIHLVFRGLKFEHNTGIGQNGAFCKGLYKCVRNYLQLWQKIPIIFKIIHTLSRHSE